MVAHYVSMKKSLKLSWTLELLHEKIQMQKVCCNFSRLEQLCKTKKNSNSKKKKKKIYETSNGTLSRDVTTKEFKRDWQNLEGKAGLKSGGCNQWR